MPAEIKREIELKIAHVLFIDIVAYSKLASDDQHAAIEKLNQIVQSTDEFRKAESENRLLKLPTGDGMALIFYNSPEAPVECALEISRALKEHPQLLLRMGAHSGPVSGVVDVTGRANVAGAGINMAQRVMDCGDGGHILLSKRIAEDLGQFKHWRAHLYDLGECGVKHGSRVHIFNLYTTDLGNRERPKKLKTATKERTFRRVAKAVLVAIVAVALSFVLLQRFTRRSSGGAAVPEKSIAVLPFENLSEEKANAFFAAGIQDEILTRLAKIGALKVISRSSTQQYQTKPANLHGIAEELGVANILEGSVQKIGNQVHINVQLIKAATNAHLWAESYDRELKNIFGVEGEVAGAIAEALNAKLTGAEEKALAEKPTNNVAAYNAYLQAQAVWISHYDAATGRQAIARLSEAVRLDPSFALAWARKAMWQSYFYFNAIDLETNSPEAIKEAADRAFALQPELGEAWIAQGYYLYRVKRDFPAALQAFEQARQRIPNSADVCTAIGFVEKRQGRWDAAEKDLQRAVQLDPRDLSVLMALGGELYAVLRRHAQAQSILDRALTIAPEDEIVLASKALDHQTEGRLDEAAKDLDRIRSDAQEEIAARARATQFVYQRQYDQAIATLQAWLKDNQTWSGYRKTRLLLLGDCQQWAGRTDDARTTYQQAIDAIKPAPDATVPVDETLLQSALASAYAALGEKEKALAEANRAVESYAGDAMTQPLAKVALAAVQARVGDSDPAIATLLSLLDTPNGVTRATLRLDPTWDPLRNNPRFHKLATLEAP